MANALVLLIAVDGEEIGLEAASGGDGGESEDEASVVVAHQRQLII